MRFGVFGRGKADTATRDGAAQIKAWTIRLLGLPPDTVVAVNEIICADPACPGTETVILVMQPGRRTAAFKLAMAMAEVTEPALDTALRA